MENSQYEGAQYFSQLDTIKSIENSLNQLKSRIHFLQKQDNRTVQQIEKVFTSTIPILKNKIAESNINAKNNAIRNDMQQYKFQKAEEIRMSRIEQQNEINKNKMELNKTKAHQSFYIRQMSKKNQKIIIEARRQFIKQKKKKSQLVKMFHMQSKRKIEEFHNQKQNQLKKIRNEEKISLDRRIEIITQSLAIVSKVEQQQSKKYQGRENMLKKLKKIVFYLQGMKPEFLQHIMASLKLTNDALDDEYQVQRILLQIERRKNANGLVQTNRMSLDRNERPQQRKKKSQSMDLQYIYGNGYYKKMR